VTTPVASPRRPLWHRIPTEWKLARLDGAGSIAHGWIPASVPGAVQLDWARAKGLPDPTVGENFRLLGGLEDDPWLYRTKVPRAPLSKGERLHFTCSGADYACEVRLGGKVVLEHEGMFSPFEIDLAGCEPGADLDVLFRPAPKRPGRPADRTQASASCKPAVSYGWDFHPRLIPLGLWAEAGFELRPEAHLRHVDFSYVLSEDLSRATITVAASTHGPAGYSWSLRDAASRAVVESSEPRAVLENPALWWTHDQGQPALYSLEVRSVSGDVYRRSVGFRRIRLVMHEGAWEEPQGFPATRNNPPVTVELNGRVIFAKGSNWVGADMFPGRITEGDLSRLLHLAQGAHFNLLRCWGGAIVNQEAFFDKCDELGLLVWQEFPLACNNYPDDESYLRVLDQESRSIIGRLRQHPCVAIWGGGNELFNAWSGMTDQSLALRLLNRNCYDLDPATPFLATAPLQGMGHGDYRFRDVGGRDVFEIFQGARNTAYSEFGCPGPSPVEYLRTFIPEAELWPPRPGASWQAHHAYGAWEADSTSWLFPGVQEHYFGPAADLNTLVERGTWLQSIGYKVIFEEARRQKPRCSMALNWCFNEPWPTAAGNSIVNWPARAKPSYFAVQAACRPVLASARIPKFQWREGEEFQAEIWILNDSPDEIPEGQLEVAIETGGVSEKLHLWSYSRIPAGRNLAGPTVRRVLPSAPDGAFELVLRTGPGDAWGSRYRLSLLPASR
jgi:beta-mannosidase